MEWSWHEGQDPEPLVSLEWLVTNGLGGYASGTVSGVISRRYHGLLISAQPAPLGRVNMLSHLAECVILPDGREMRLGGEERAGNKLRVPGSRHLREFRLEAGLPVWRYQLDGFVIEKRVILPHLQNSAYISYRLIDGDAAVRMELHPAVHFRPHESPVTEPLANDYVFRAVGRRFEIYASPDLPLLRLLIHGATGAFMVEGKRMPEMVYRIEESRGYESVGELWNPGYCQFDLQPGASATLVASTESWTTIEALEPEIALAAECDRRRRLLDLTNLPDQKGLAAELVLEADKFIIMPAARVRETARAHAAGEEARTVIAGYHWFTDWGRDTMISLEGLTLVTGRFHEAEYILDTFASHVRDGLIPNMFPEHENDGLYHTADATLWFFHAADRFLAYTGNAPCLRRLLPVFRSIVRHHLQGTRFGIGVDPRDGLLRQGQDGYQLTWMDAKMGDWVVTPRRGKAVELNALWFNALCLMEKWLREAGDAKAAADMANHAEQTRQSFNERFWYPEGEYLFDVVDGEDGNDDACRPNQALAISLPHPVLEANRWKAVLAVVKEKLLTPVGLRSLSRDHPEYKPNYHGDLRTRDAAYHQGTIWPWLIGPYYDAWLKTYPGSEAEVRKGLGGLIAHLDDACIGSVSEVFDAEPPFTARGCVAQAWSAAEVLRLWAKIHSGLPE